VLPAQTRGIRDGAARSGARLVVLDNLYVYGDTTRMSEDSPIAPRSRKGELRAEALSTWMELDEAIAATAAWAVAHYGHHGRDGTGAKAGSRARMRKPAGSTPVSPP